MNIHGHGFSSRSWAPRPLVLVLVLVLVRFLGLVLLSPPATCELELSPTTSHFTTSRKSMIPNKGIQTSSVMVMGESDSTGGIQTSSVVEGDRPR